MTRLKLNIIGNSYDIDVERKESKRFFVIVNGKRYEALVEDDSDKGMLIAVDGGLFSVELECEPSTGKINAKVNNRVRAVENEDFIDEGTVPEKQAPVEATGETLLEEEQRQIPSAAMVSGIVAPLPGKVVAVKVNVGDKVCMGDVVVILEAMKMENEITSNKDGNITEIRVKPGDTVDADDLLVVVA